MNKSYARNMVLTAFGAVLIAFCAWLTVPFAVPFTLQTLGVFAVLQILGGKRGVCSILLYVALGMLGIPVFSGFNAGFGVLLGPTGGYILGFIASGVLYWLLERFALQSRRKRLVLLACCQLVCYVAGVLGYMLWSANADVTESLLSALAVCVLPYLLTDVFKLLMSVYLSERVSRSVRV